MKRSRAGDAENIFDACMADVLAEETGTDRDQRERALEEVGLVAQAVEEARAEDAEVSYAAWRKENLLPVIYPSGEPEDLDRPSSPLAPSASSSSDHEQQPSRAAPQTSHGSAIPSHGMNQLVQEQQLMMHCCPSPHASMNSISSTPPPACQRKNSVRWNMVVKYSATCLNIS